MYSICNTVCFLMSAAGFLCKVNYFFLCFLFSRHVWSVPHGMLSIPSRFRNTLFYFPMMGGAVGVASQKKYIIYSSKTNKLLLEF